VLPPNHPGRLVLNLDDISVNTELINGSPDASFTLLARSLNVLLLDDIVAPPPEMFKDIDVERGYQHWVVCLDRVYSLDMKLTTLRNPAMHQSCTPVTYTLLLFIPPR
jgi:hypothetical protein